LYINVVDFGNACKPLSGVAVDISLANAAGLYSDESSQQAGGGTSSTAGDTIKDNWLRGYQITGIDRGLRRKPIAGQVSFKTIWPGWYTGRAIHIHVRVRKLSSAGKTISGYTTKIFFSDHDNAHVLRGAAPYNSRSPQADPTTDENDTVLTSAARSTNIVTVIGSINYGFAATFNIAATVRELSTQGNLSRPNGIGAGNSGPGASPAAG
jgi:protocatechuate 3,4-dioxygenase beta subunit